MEFQHDAHAILAASKLHGMLMLVMRDMQNMLGAAYDCVEENACDVQQSIHVLSLCLLKSACVQGLALVRRRCKWSM